MDGTLVSIDKWAGKAGDNLIFGENMQQFMRVLHPICRLHLYENVEFHLPSVSRVGQITHFNTHNLNEFFNNNVGMIVYFGSAKDGFLAYTSPRDDLTCIALPNQLPTQLIERLDRRFLKHFHSGGIGFGNDGRSYFRRLIKHSLPKKRLKQLTG